MHFFLYLYMGANLLSGLWQIGCTLPWSNHHRYGSQHFVWDMTDWLYISLRHSPPDRWERQKHLWSNKNTKNVPNTWNTNTFYRTRKTQLITKNKNTLYKQQENNFIYQKKTKTHFARQKNKNTFHRTKEKQKSFESQPFVWDMTD